MKLLICPFLSNPTALQLLYLLPFNWSPWAQELPFSNPHYCQSNVLMVLSKIYSSSPHSHLTSFNLHFSREETKKDKIKHRHKIRVRTRWNTEASPLNFCPPSLLNYRWCSSLRDKPLGPRSDLWITLSTGPGMFFISLPACLPRGSITSLINSPPLSPLLFNQNLRAFSILI